MDDMTLGEYLGSLGVDYKSYGFIKSFPRSFYLRIGFYEPGYAIDTNSHLYDSLVTVRDNEYNFTLNPTSTSGSTSITSSIGTFFTPGQFLNNNVTGSYFTPYITTVGLYDEYQNLLAVGKLSQLTLV